MREDGKEVGSSSAMNKEYSEPTALVVSMHAPH